MFKLEEVVEQGWFRDEVFEEIQGKGVNKEITSARIGQGRASNQSLRKVALMLRKSGKRNMEKGGHNLQHTFLQICYLLKTVGEMCK